MSSKTIFTQTHAPRTNRLVDGFDSAVYSNLAIGKIQGQYRTLPALMSPLATDDDVWHIVNLQAGGQDGFNVYDAVAVLGAASGEQAKEWALQQHGQFYDAVATDVQQTSSQGLMRHLANRHFHAYQSPVRANDLAAMQDVVTGQQVQWDGIDLKSHSGQTGIMLVDMIKHDDHHLLLDAMDRDGLTELLASIGAEFAHYDALIVEKHNLDRLMSRLSTSMAKASEAGVSIAKVTQSEPFKKNKVTQIAVLFEMSDGQSVAIVFHNPDTTPSQLLPQDTLISWKWMLNGRDVSAAIQPNQGEDVQLPVLATRIMKLVNQNSARFKRQQATKAKTQQELDEARKRLGEQVEEIAALDGEMADIQKQIDEPAPNPVELTPANNMAEYTQEQLITPEVYATISASDELKLRYQDFYDSFFQKRMIDVRNALRQLGWTEQGQDTELSKKGTYAQFSFDKVGAGANVVGFSVNEIQDGLTQTPQELAAALDEKANHAAIETMRKAVEEFAANKPGYKGFTESMEATSDIINEPDGSWMVLSTSIGFSIQYKLPNNQYAGTEFSPSIEQAYEKYQRDLKAHTVNPDGHNSGLRYQSDIDYLQSIINGRVDATTVDMDFIIELAEKYQDDEAMNALVEQALEIINQAEQAAAQLVA